MNTALLNLFASYMEKQEILSKLTESEKLHGYNYSEIHTMDAIGKVAEPNVTGIAAYLHMTRGAISKIAKKLQQDGLIETYRLPDNQQKIFYSLTEKGKVLCDEHEKRHALWLQRDDEFLSQYDPEYLCQIERFMTDFNAYLEKKIEQLGGTKDVVDMTLKITPKMVKDAQGNEKKALVGHLGTHFDVMNKEFPLEYTKRKGLVFDVSHVDGRDIGIDDVDLDRVEQDMFVAFFTSFIESEGYGSQRYFSEHPQLSRDLIDALLEKGVSIIGVDFAGVRRGKEHTPTDQYCADNGVFIIENLCHLKGLTKAGKDMVINTYPMNYADMTGLPCRVVAEAAL